MPLPGSGRNSVGAKSPLTGAFGESEVGGYWGAEHLWGLEVGQTQDAILSELGAHKARLLYQMGWTRSFGHLTGMCNFVAYTPEQMVEAVRAVTGWPMSVYRLQKSVEKTVTLCRIFNLREGFSDAADRLPERFLEESHGEGFIKGIRIDPKQFDETKKMYYQMLGWNERGIPTEPRLAELDIEWAKRYLLA